MSKKYWIHRISHELELSYPLLTKGYLAYGWSRYINTDLKERTRAEGWPYFEKFMSEDFNTARSRYSLWRFINFNDGDIVVVPLFGGKFCICEVCGDPIEANKLPFSSIISENNEELSLTPNGYFSKVQNRIIDIGYVVPVRNITSAIPRSFADAQLVSRMKIRQTNADVGDLAESIDRAMTADKPVNIHAQFIEATIDPIKKVIQKYVTPDNFEQIIRNYMMKMGADRVWIPPKNEEHKENGADADVIAEFDDLRIVFYIQAKKHSGNTGDWAVKQIAEYREQKHDPFSDFTYIPWAISTAEFSDDAIRSAQENGVRLIGGTEFVRMIVDAGISDILSDTDI